MTTKRTPIRRPPRDRFTAEALAAFRKMHELEDQCTCAPRDWEGEYWKHEECSACDEWWQQHSILHRELRCRPWQWPCVEHPDAVTPYPEGTWAAKNWKPDLEAQARYRELAKATGIP